MPGTDTVTYDSERNVTLVISIGRATIDDWDKSRAQILNFYEKFGSNRVLVDVRKQEAAPGIMEVFSFGSNWPHLIKLAIVIGPETEDAHRFLETVAVNRGRPINLFKSDAEALEWLRV